MPEVIPRSGIAVRPAPEPVSVPHRGPASARTTTGASRLGQVQALQSRIRSMQKRGLGERLLPTMPGLGALLPGGGLRCGAVYSVESSHTLLLAMLAGASAAGSWCGVIGVPDLGLECASEFGIATDRLVLVPRPGEKWLTVTAALADVLPLVVTRVPTKVLPADAARLAARLRQRGSTLIALGEWPGCEARLSLSENNWSGLGSGHGHLTAREAVITVSGGSLGRPAQGLLRLDAHGARVDPRDAQSTLRRLEQLPAQSTA